MIALQSLGWGSLRLMRSQLDHALTCFKELLKQLLKQINYLQSQLKQPLPFFYYSNHIKHPNNSHHSIKIGSLTRRMRSEVPSCVLGRGCPSMSWGKKSCPENEQLPLISSSHWRIPLALLSLGLIPLRFWGTVALSLTWAGRRQLEKCCLGQGWGESRMLAPGHRYSHSDHMRVGEVHQLCRRPQSWWPGRGTLLGLHLSLPPLVHDAWSSASQPPIVVLVSPIMIIGTARNMAFSFWCLKKGLKIVGG